MSDKTKGILSLTVSAFGFALMALFVRLCDDYGASISSFQKSFFRNLIACLIALVACLRLPHPSSLIPRPSSLFLLLTLRATIGTIGIFANFYALSHITIAEGQALNKTAPFFTVLFAWLFLGEKASRRQILPLILAFLGVLLIVQPGFVGVSILPLSMGLLGGVCAGGAYACVRALRRHKVDSTVIVLFFSVFSCLASVPFMIADFTPMTYQQVLILLSAGGGAALGQFGITLAYGFAAPREIAVYDYSNILFTALFGFFFFSQVPTVFSLVGFVVILFAAFRLFR